MMRNPERKTSLALEQLVSFILDIVTAHTCTYCTYIYIIYIYLFMQSYGTIEQYYFFSLPQVLLSALFAMASGAKGAKLGVHPVWH